jgi:aspartyl protease family protein
MLAAVAMAMFQSVLGASAGASISVGALPAEPVIAEQAMAVAAPAGPSSARFVIVGPARTAAGNEIRRAGDGLFYVMAIVNGAPVRFIVDTGATVVVLTPDDARRAGIAVEQADFSASAQTANGRAAMARVRLAEIVVGTTRKEAVEAAVVGEGLAVSLLGQSWLSKLDSMTIQRDRMLLN